LVLVGLLLLIGQQRRTATPHPAGG
jgi:hypothetical protein